MPSVRRGLTATRRGRNFSYHGFDNLRCRLDRIERTKGTGPSGPGRLPAVEIISGSDTDFARQLAALQAAGRYTPGQLVIDRRIIDPEDMRL